MVPRPAGCPILLRRGRQRLPRKAGKTGTPTRLISPTRSRTNLRRRKGARNRRRERRTRKPEMRRWKSGSPTRTRTTNQEKRRRRLGPGRKVAAPAAIVLRNRVRSGSRTRKKKAIPPASAAGPSGKSAQRNSGTEGKLRPHIGFAAGKKQRGRASHSIVAGSLWLFADLRHRFRKRRTEVGFAHLRNRWAAASKQFIRLKHPQPPHRTRILL